jgi:ABC-type phosphate transport system substrate-binding protein
MGLLTTKRVASLLAAGASVLALGATSGTASAACANITGTGATLQTAAQGIWIGRYTGCPGNVSYTGIGSGAGLNRWKADGTAGAPSGDAWISTDDAPTATQINNIKAAAGGVNLQVFPVLQAAVAVLVNLPDNCSAIDPSNSLLIDSDALEDAYDSTATFSTLFPGQLTGAGCSAASATAFARSGGSGTTQIFKEYFSLLPDWRGNDSGDTSWPGALVRTTATSGSSIASLVRSTPNSLGYAVLADALNAGLNSDPTADAFWVLVDNDSLNSGGNWQDPEVVNGATHSSNCAGTPYTGVPASTVNGDWSGTFGVFANGTGTAYPICGLSYAVAYDDPYQNTSPGPSVTGRTYTAAQGDTANSYLSFITSTAGQALIDAGNYAQLPRALQATANAAASSVSR